MKLKISISFILFLFILFFGYKFLSSSTEVINPTKGNLVESIYGLGTVTASNIFSAKTGISLPIQKLFVKEGDRLNAGDPLVAFDVTTLRTPISGTVTNVFFQKGEIVPPQVPIVTVTNLNDLYLEVSLEQQSVLRVRKGQVAIISFENLRNDPATGEVTSIFPRANQFIVRIELKKWPEGVLPGMTADTAIQVGNKDNVLLIPLSAIQSGLVTRLRNGKKEKIPVKLGVVDGSNAELISGDIQLSDELIIRK